MYESYYKLAPTPFRLTPDPHFYFNSASHQRGLAFLRYAFHQREGFVVITGAPGTGKTELMLNLIHELPRSQTNFAKIVTSNLGANDLLELVASSFLLSPLTGHKGMLLKDLEDFFIAQHRLGKHVLLLIDEAHNLSTSALVELSMLCNFQYEEKPLLQCFLMGQPGLEQKLEIPELVHLKQRVLVSTHLEPFFERETQAYIEHRLTKSGWHGDPDFSDTAYALIHQYSEGIPRRINSICNRLFLEAYLEETHHIDTKLVRKIIKEMQEEAIATKMSLDLDFADIQTQTNKLMHEEITAGSNPDSILIPELQFPQKSSVNNVIDVSRFGVDKQQKIQDKQVWWGTNEQLSEKYLPENAKTDIDESTTHAVQQKTDKESIKPASNDNIHHFPINSNSPTTGDVMSKVSQPNSNSVSVENDHGSHEKKQSKPTFEPVIKVKSEHSETTRQSGLLDKELRALASWYQPATVTTKKEPTSTNNDNQDVTTKTTIVDNLVQQEYEPEIAEIDNDSHFTEKNSWLPFSKTGITISVISLIVLWWYTYGPGVSDTIQAFEALNRVIESLLITK